MYLIFSRLLLINKGRNKVANRLGRKISMTDLFLILEFARYVDRRVLEEFLNNVILLREYKTVSKYSYV